MNTDVEGIFFGSWDPSKGLGSGWEKKRNHHITSGLGCRANWCFRGSGSMNTGPIKVVSMIICTPESRGNARHMSGTV